jgi:hypothetical protein
VPTQRALVHEGGAWVQAAEWKTYGGRFVERAGAGFLIAPWKPHTPSDKAPAARRDYPLGLVQKGHDRVSPMGTKLVPQVPEEHLFPEPVLSMTRAGDALFIAAMRGSRLAVERQRGGGDRVDDITRLAEGEYANATLWAAGPDDAAVYGDVGSAPLLQRFDGRAWSAVAIPPGIDRVAAYDRTSAGAERIFAYTGKALSMFERASGAAPWQPIVLPTLTRGDTVHEVWLANDDAWLLIWPGREDAPHSTAPRLTARLSRGPRLMRMKPVARVWTYPRELPANLGW